MALYVVLHRAYSREFLMAYVAFVFAFARVVDEVRSEASVLRELGGAVRTFVGLHSCVNPTMRDLEIFY